MEGSIDRAAESSTDGPISYNVRIAYFSESLPPQRDGVCRTISHLMGTLEDEGVEFLVASGIEPCPSLSWRNRVHRLPSLPFPLYDYYRFSIPVASSLDRAVDAFRPDLVHVLNPTLLGVYGIRYARSRGIPVVTSYHTRYAAYLPYYRLGAMTGVAWQLMNWFYNRCDATFAPSFAAIRELEERGIRRVGLWSRGIDTELFSPSYRRIDLRRRVRAEGRPILLYVGRLVKEKNLDALATAARELAARGLRFRLVLVGDGPMRADLERRLPDAHFTGFLTGRALAEWYASADVFAFPSVTETLGNVVLEAFASGLPVAGMAEGGVGDLIDPGVNGLAGTPGDPHGFTDALAAMLTDAGLRRRLSGGALATARRHDWSSVNRGLLDNYRHILNGGARLRPFRAAAADEVRVGAAP